MQLYYRHFVKRCWHLAELWCRCNRTNIECACVVSTCTKVDIEQECVGLCIGLLQQECRVNNILTSYEMEMKVKINHLLKNNRGEK